LEKWRWIPYRVHSAAENMAIDEAIMLAQSSSDVPPTLRFYGWEPAACSIGYFQKMERELDLAALQKRGISYVRRITGGRTVFHDQELTYSLIVGKQHALYAQGVSQSYYQISQGLLAGFAELGLAAMLSPPRQQRLAATGSSSVCFDQASDYELVIDGKKVVGSAQTRKQNALLQHGSILLSLDLERFFSLLAFPSESARHRLQKNFAKRVGTINEFAARPVSLIEVIAAFRLGFAQGMHIELEEGALTEAELEMAKQLQEEKYNTDEWNLQR
jgi:lipoyl(octanoyl) transferase